MWPSPGVDGLQSTSSLQVATEQVHALDEHLHIDTSSSSSSIKTKVLTAALCALQMSRSLGYIPLLIWGVMGSPIPKRVPMHLVLGSPIPVKQADNPEKAEVEATLQNFIQAMKALYEKHKADAGYAESVHLHVY